MKIQNALLVGIIAVGITTTAYTADSPIIEKKLSENWTWFDDYLFAYATYTLACEQQCVCKAGMGVKAFGKPRGERKQFTGTIEVTVIGMGAIHIKRVSGISSCKARVTLGNDPSMVTLISGPWDL